MGYGIQSAGPVSIFSAVGQSSGAAGSSSLVGNWISIHPDCTRLTVMAKLGTASAGATASSSGVIELSHNGVTAAKTLAGSIQLTGTTDAVADGITLATSMLGVWPFIRFNMQALSSATAADSNGSTGQPSMNVTVAAAWRT